MSELTLFLIRFAYLAILWIFVLSAISVIRSDMFGARVPETARGTAAPSRGSTAPSSGGVGSMGGGRLPYFLSSRVVLQIRTLLPSWRVVGWVSRWEPM